MPAAQQLDISVRARLLQANPAPEHDGQLILQVLSEANRPRMQDGFVSPAAQLNIRLVLASAGDAYGESRHCSIDHAGNLSFTLTAGLDEQNFVAFEPAKSDRAFHFSLNKYLCRALAAPFHCVDALGGTKEISLPPDMARWNVGALTSVELESSGVEAKAAVSSIALRSNGKPFDYAACATVAPSNGICCVAHKTTEWHCGGTPAGEGWHQVSGDCFHRETGGTCSQ